MKPLSLSRARRVVVVAPHADDEAIGAWGLIARVRRRGARVRVVVVTGGAASHPGSLRWPRARLVAERRRESRAAMRRLGVPAGDCVFLGLPDGGLSAMPQARLGAIGAAVRRCRPDLIVSPVADDAHPDHRAVAAALGRDACGDARYLHYLVWPDRTGAPARATARLTLGPAVAAKRAAILRYRTQCGRIADDPAGFCISRRELAGFARPVERYREVRR